ncbi:MAG: HRDC domain-containing protein [Cellulomonadaceae bacterium]|jgi:ribonuclease D|nr:HRDC domain-containing protein [Cellulomonadaceae bacterium]
MSAPAQIPDGLTTVPHTEPEGGVPTVIDSPRAFERTIAAFAAASGPVAADAERASGIRYGQATYLAQLKRAGAGIALIDPVALPDLSALGKAIGDAEWILHAASQDLPGLADHGLTPARLFDTELAARLLGIPRVGLASIVAECLGLELAKEFSNVDWSKRPLPADWLRYAALDVDVLIELRDVLAQRLADAGKLQWALQEFEAVRTTPPAEPRVDPWRRTSGITAFKDARRLAVVRALWQAREDSARNRNIAPGRVLPDRAIVAAAQALPRTAGQLVRVSEFAGQGQRRRAAQWQRAIDEALNLPESALPSTKGPHKEGPPQPRMWERRKPEAAGRLAAAREFMAAASEELSTPVENLLPPEALRRLCWQPPMPVTATTVADALHTHGARPWQVELFAAPLSKILKALGT